ncbi:MAG TPA: glutaredoxin domain-containing protein [Candidatus Paceibacterota bacterium]|nr:glutaredoxin domain-containing protein [Candidatus Paceibacterota bacterium]
MADQKPVTIYSTPTCHFCHAAKEFFGEHNIAFTEYNVASDLAKRQEMIQKSGQMGVPVIDVGGELVVGFDEDRLRELLNVPA